MTFRWEGTDIEIIGGRRNTYVLILSDSRLSPSHVLTSMSISTEILLIDVFETQKGMTSADTHLVTAGSPCRLTNPTRSIIQAIPRCSSLSSYSTRLLD